MELLWISCNNVWISDQFKKETWIISTHSGLVMLYETAYHCLRSLYQDVWDAERYLKPKLHYYNLFKPDLSQEEYLSLNIPKYQWSLFAQFRGGVLLLQVEIDKFRKILLEERLCNLCDMGQVEDEFHFFCICTNYSDLREVLYIKAARVFPAFSELDELEKFVYLLNNLQRHVIIYLNDAVYRRRSSLFNSWMYSNDSHTCVLYCFLNVFVTYKPNGAGWFCLILSVYMMYMYITCHVNEDYVMFCYVMLYGIIELSTMTSSRETFSMLLALCAGNSPVTGEFPTQRPVTRSFDVLFDLWING